MSACNKCFRYRSKEREIDALRHELGIAEDENKHLRETITKLVGEGECIYTTRADYATQAVGYYPGAGGGAMAAQQALAQQNAQIQAGGYMANALQARNAQLQGQWIGAGGCGGAAGGNGGAGLATSARAWCDTHKRWAEECQAYRGAWQSLGDVARKIVGGLMR